ncbi:hypothetical protein [Pseudomonas sp. P1.31]|uniref:hypothetical protein n=1 Tax=Pseudomonas sp. P1.31 TaxID=1699311 RepID=UPI000AA64D11|nr:hypothetical protein [Pseudomonas sp. P1.31]
MGAQKLQPRFIRAGEAPAHLSMNLPLFNQLVRPFVNEFPIGARGAGFDRQELDAWASSYVAAKAIDKKGAGSNNCLAASARKEKHNGAKNDHRPLPKERSLAYRQENQLRKTLRIYWNK